MLEEYINKLRKEGFTIYRRYVVANDSMQIHVSFGGNTKEKEINMVDIKASVPPDFFIVSEIMKMIEELKEGDSNGRSV